MRNRIVLSLALILSCAIGAHTQTRQSRRAPKPPPQSPSPVATSMPLVTVKLKNGKDVTGKFISANSLTLIVKVESISQEIPIAEISAVQFDTEQAAAPDASAAREAIKALRRLDSAVSVGLNYREYGTRLVDTRVAVDEALENVPDGEVKLEIILAMNSYKIASDVWETKIQDGPFMETSTPFFKALLKAYPELFSAGNIDLGTKEQVHVSVDEVLSIIWRSARTHLDKAANFLR